jgi:hypothetical protein
MNIVLAIREHGIAELEELSGEEDRIKRRLAVIRKRRQLLLDLMDRIMQDSHDPEVVGKDLEQKENETVKGIIELARHRAKRQAT